ncbi:MAG: hypothetical protein WA364_30100 [Candidatus Nitrosopolaris sp.]|jgi:hypothetical protein
MTIAAAVLLFGSGAIVGNQQALAYVYHRTLLPTLPTPRIPATGQQEVNSTYFLFIINPDLESHHHFQLDTMGWMRIKLWISLQSWISSVFLTVYSYIMQLAQI